MMRDRASMHRLPGLLLLLLLLALAAPSVSAGTATSWSLSTAEQFARGTLDGTAIDDEGRVVLAPDSETLWGPEEGIVWGVAVAGQGALLALSGPGRVLEIDRTGRPRVWFDFGEDNLVTAIVGDGAGGVYFGLSPEGLVYHSSGPGEAAEKIKTGATFVWGLAVDDEQTLWIGTGVPGLLMRRSGTAEAVEVFQAGDDPVRCIAALPGGGAVFGTGGRGLVIRVDREGRPFVLLDTDEAEVVDLVARDDGTIFALTASGPKQVGSSSGDRSEGRGATERVRVVANPPGQKHGSDEPAAEAPAKPPSSSRQHLKVQFGGAVYRIDPDGGSRKIWSAVSEMPFAMLESEGRLLVATGGAGRIHTLDDEGRSARLIRIPSEQASAMVRGADGRILVGGSTDARLIVLSQGNRGNGTYRSEVIDAGTAAEWGRVSWDAETPRGTRIGLNARAGNTAEPDETWTPWLPVEADRMGQGGRADLPGTRWVQLELDLSSHGDDSPMLRGLDLSFMPRNRPPVVSALEAESLGVVWARGPAQSSSRLGPLAANDPISRQAITGLLRKRSTKGSIRRSYEAGARTFSWTAEDQDGDRLVYSLEVRREGANRWSALATAIDEPFYTWDARGIPDGRYRVRVTATDSRDNSASRQLSGRRVSAVFRVDNTRPLIEAVRFGSTTTNFHVDFVASDPGGSIAAVEVALDGGDWEPLEPLDGVADSPEERYRLEIERGGSDNSAPPSVMVRVSDAAGNLGGDIWQIGGDD